MKLRAAVFASGTGTNFEVLADHAAPDWEVVLLVSDREAAPVRAKARARGISAVTVPVSGRDSGEVERDTLALLVERRIDFVLLAGYLRLIPPGVVAHFRGRMLNLHPALLPSFGGKGMYGRAVHEAVLASGARISGVTVHFVDERYDRGRVLAQWPVPVLPGDTADTLARRVHALEHRLLPAAVDELARALGEGREPRPIPGGGAHFHLQNDLPRPGSAHSDSPNRNDP